MVHLWDWKVWLQEIMQDMFMPGQRRKFLSILCKNLWRSSVQQGLVYFRWWKIRMQKILQNMLEINFCWSDSGILSTEPNNFDPNMDIYIMICNSKTRISALHQECSQPLNMNEWKQEQYFLIWVQTQNIMNNNFVDRNVDL